MKLINARQVWTEAQHESNASISAVAIERSESAPVKTGGRIGKREVQFPALGSEKGEEAARFAVPGQRISINETRRTPIGRSTARAAHLATIGKVLRAIDTLPFQVQQFGHYLYHPAMNMKHLLNAVLLITAKAELPGLTSAKRVKAQYLVTLALQSYKGEAHGAVEWGPARVASEMKEFFGVTIDPKNWTRDWLELWESLKEVIKEVDIQAQQPVWQVIHAEKDQEAA
ncbi:hypothetical protein A9978_31700 [Pseudomonas sp. UMC65]|uniref:hypothetical protein n=1 Tax=unclassified Pseudomonas TaxID=196821 RepID=UPI0016047F53|nr:MULTISPECIES: hypothetical protein [unclassified Pseudomonas]MBB1617023.1 hypothetical protein [Pseudomonas sp. UMC65]MBB1623090.1 hypothetical protein [Pseudomonas sp. UME65]